MTDKYYTNPKMALELIEITKNLYDFNNFDAILEPSAGNGSFSKHIHHNNLIAIDIQPDDSSIIQADFLKYDFSHLNYKKVLVIGNPPFATGLITKFIKKICSISNVFALILPMSYLLSKNRIKTIDKYFHLKYHKLLDDNAFVMPNGDAYRYPTCYLIYEKQANTRDVIEIVSKYFKFVKNTDDYDAIILRTGYKSGNIITDDFKYKGRNYYIKLNNDIHLEKFLIEYKKINFLLNYNKLVINYVNRDMIIDYTNGLDYEEIKKMI